MDLDTLSAKLALYVDVELLQTSTRYEATRGLPRHIMTFNGPHILLKAQNLLFINNAVKRFSLNANHYTDRHCDRVFLEARVRLTKTKWLDTDGQYIVITQAHFGRIPYRYTSHMAGITSELLYTATAIDWTEMCRHPQKYNYNDVQEELYRVKHGYYRTEPLRPATIKGHKVLQPNSYKTGWDTVEYGVLPTPVRP